MSQNNDLEKHFTASALIIDNGKVLLLHHKKLGVWLYPGGHIEKNETPDQLNGAGVSGVPGVGDVSNIRRTVLLGTSAYGFFPAFLSYQPAGEEQTHFSFYPPHLTVF